MTKGKYVPCLKTDIPAGMRFDVPDRHQGQIIEVAYGGFGSSEIDDGVGGAVYKRVTDRGVRPDHPEYAMYYRRLNPELVEELARIAALDVPLREGRRDERRLLLANLGLIEWHERIPGCVLGGDGWRITASGRVQSE